MEQDIKNLLAEVADLKERIKKIQAYFFWTAVITVALFVLPLIALAFAIPAFLGQISELQNIGL